MYKKLNYAIGDVASTTAINATTLTLKAGHTITTDIGETNKFVAVFYDGTKSSPYQDTNREIVEAYRTDTNDFVIARAKEGTSAKQWVENDKFMLIASAGVFNEYETELDGKQDSLGYAPENVANKKTTITDSDTDYPTGKAVKTAVDAKQDALGYIAENSANKKTDLSDNSDTYYPTQKAVKTALDAKQDTLTFGIANTNAVKIDDAFVADNDYAKFTANGIEGVPYSTVLSDIGAQAALGYTPENVANKKTTITDSDVDYPTCKAVNTGLSGKQNTLGFTPENVANKKTTITDSDVDYPTCKAVKTAVDAKEPILTKGNLSGSGVITIDNTRQVIGGAAIISHTDSATVRHVTDTEKATWNAKQDALGFTPENVANKETTALDTSTTKYPCNNVVKEAVDAKQDALGYIAENAANKKTSLTDNSDTYYPTQKAVKTAVDSKVNLDQTTPQTITDGSPLFSEGVDMANDKWLKSKDYAGTGYLNILKGNEDNEVDVGTQLNVGSIEAEEDSGAISLFDMAVSSASADGTEMSATIKIDGNNILKIYAESDGAGGADTFKVQLLNKAVLTMEDSTGTTHTYTADTDGSLIIS